MGGYYIGGTSMSVKDRATLLKNAPYWGDNDALFDLIREVAIEKYLLEMDKQFGKTHSINILGGGGTTGSFTTAIEVNAPWERKTGILNWLACLLCPTKRVMYFSLVDLGLYHRCDENYREFAEKMKRDFDEQIAPYLK